MLDPGRRIVRGTGRAPQGAHLADLLHRPARRGARTGVGVCPARRSPERRSDSSCRGTDAHGPPVVRARSRLARATGLTRVTVADLVEPLLTEGLLAEVGQQQGGVGKPGTLIRLSTDAYRILAVDLTDDRLMRGAVLDLGGSIVARRNRALATVGEEAVCDLIEFCEALVADANRPVLGLGIASPGIIDPDGTVLDAPGRGWRDLPLAARASSALHVPVHVANDANASALGDLTFGKGSAGGQLIQGHRFAAGELGHVTAVDPGVDVRSDLGQPERCVCGRLGCLETVASLPALRRRTAGLDPAGIDEVLTAAGTLLGVVLSPVVSALNVADVVLGGPATPLAGPFIRALRDALARRTLPTISGSVCVRMSTLGEDAALAGAAVLVLAGELGVT